MEQENKKGEILSLIHKYRLIRDDDLVVHVRTSMEEVQSTCQKVELSENIRVLQSELPHVKNVRDYCPTQRISYPFGLEYFNVV